MALRGVPCSITWGRVGEDSAQFHFITNFTSSVESVHWKYSSSAIASLRARGQAAERSCFWATDRELQLEVQKKIRTKRTVLVFKSGATSRGLRPTALQGGARAPRRLVDFVKAIPNISRAYFKSPFRRALYGGISLLLGFYVAQTISLSFGALGVNDVIAAALCVLFAEYVTKYYHTRVCGLVPSAQFKKDDLHPPLRALFEDDLDMGHWNETWGFLLAEENDDRDMLIVDSPAWFCPQQEHSLFRCILHKKGIPADEVDDVLNAYVLEVALHMHGLPDLVDIFDEEEEANMVSGEVAAGTLVVFGISDLEGWEITLTDVNVDMKVLSSFVYSVVTSDKKIHLARFDDYFSVLVVED